MRTLVVYFSRTGHTRSLAEQIAAAGSADLEAVQETNGQNGMLRYVRSLLQAVGHREASIGPSVHSPGNYEMVVLGTPIWGWNMSSPMRAYIQRHRGQFRKLALFSTCDGSGQTKVLADMQKLCDKAPVATLALTTRELHDRFHNERLEKFMEQLRQADPAHMPTTLRSHPAF